MPTSSFKFPLPGLAGQGSQASISSRSQLRAVRGHQILAGALCDQSSLKRDSCDYVQTWGKRGRSGPPYKRGNWCDPERHSPLCKRVLSKTWTVSGGPGAGNPGRGGSFRSLGEDGPPSRTGACGRTKLDGPLLRENSKFRIRSNGRAGQEVPANRRLCLALLPSPVCMSNHQTGRVGGAGVGEPNACASLTLMGLTIHHSFGRYHIGAQLDRHHTMALGPAA